MPKTVTVYNQKGKNWFAFRNSIKKQIKTLSNKDLDQLMRKLRLTGKADSRGNIIRPGVACPRSAKTKAASALLVNFAVRYYTADVITSGKLNPGIPEIAEAYLVASFFWIEDNSIYVLVETERDCLTLEDATIEDVLELSHDYKFESDAMVDAVWAAGIFPKSGGGEANMVNPAQLETDDVATVGEPPVAVWGVAHVAGWPPRVALLKEAWPGLTIGQMSNALYYAKLHPEVIAKETGTGRAKLLSAS